MPRAGAASPQQPCVSGSEGRHADREPGEVVVQHPRRHLEGVAAKREEGDTS